MFTRRSLGSLGTVTKLLTSFKYSDRTNYILCVRRGVTGAVRTSREGYEGRGRI